jgi:uncharacterized OB-fold protein
MSDDARPGGTFREALARGVLAYQVCTACARAVFFPRVLCPACGSTSLEWCESSRQGSVYAVTTLHSRSEDPHSIALVDLAEGFRVMAILENVAPDSIDPIGSAVAVSVEDGERLVARLA